MEEEKRTESSFFKERSKQPQKKKISKYEKPWKVWIILYFKNSFIRLISRKILSHTDLVEIQAADCLVNPAKPWSSLLLHVFYLWFSFFGKALLSYSRKYFLEICRKSRCQGKHKCYPPIVSVFKLSLNFVCCGWQDYIEWIRLVLLYSHYTMQSLFSSSKMKNQFTVRLN